MVTTDYKALIKSLTKKQREVFDQICIGNDRNHSPITLKSLVRKGLIEKHDQYLSPFFVVHRYKFATYGVHKAWCEVCSEELARQKTCCDCKFLIKQEITDTWDSVGEANLYCDNEKAIFEGLVEMLDPDCLEDYPETCMGFAPCK